MNIYKLMEKNWKVYCVMSSIIYIEEVQKPTEHPQIKEGKRYLCFHSARLKMKDEETTKRIFNITKKWEKTKNVKLIGKTFNKVRKENYSGQDLFYFTPLWLNLILKECGKIPNKYSFDISVKRINALKLYKKLPINKNKFLFDILLNNKKLAAGAFIISMDLEFHGVESGSPVLCMSEKYKDFLEFMLKVAKKWNWTNTKKLANVKVEYSKKLGINASPQYEFRISMKGLKEIYRLAGPLSNSFKDKCISFNIKRSNKFIKFGYQLRKKNKTKEKILRELKKNKDATTTNLQFKTGVRTDVILEHLYRLEKQGKVKKERKGKKYIWNLKW